MFTSMTKQNPLSRFHLTLMIIFFTMMFVINIQANSNHDQNPICDIAVPLSIDHDEVVEHSHSIGYDDDDDDNHHRYGCHVFIKAGASNGGNGSKLHPYNNLHDAQQNSRKGDKLCVLPSTNVLNGGIVLKWNQRLVGLGPAVNAHDFDPTKPHAQISNTTTNLDGNAVVLNRNNKVKGIRFIDVNKSAIFAKDVKSLRIVGNYFTRYNLVNDVIPLDLLGFIEFTPKPAVLMLGTGNNKADRYVLKENIFTDSQSGGLYVLQCDNSSIKVNMKSNKFTDITTFDSDTNFDLQYYATAVQTYDDSVNHSVYDGNYMNNIGFGRSNSDALSVIAEDRSKQTIRVKNHVYLNTKGVGGSSSDGFAVGLEFLMPASSESSELNIIIKDTIVDTGGRYEVAGIQYNFLGNVENSNGASMNIVMDGVDVMAGFLSVNINVIGLANKVDMLMKNSSIIGFAEPPFDQAQVFLATGLDVFIGNDFGYPAKVDDLKVTLKNSTIDRHQEHAIDLVISDLTGFDIDLGNIKFDIQDSSLTNSLGSNITVFNFGGGPLDPDSIAFDFGSDTLNSSGGNRIFGGPLDLLILNFDGGIPIDIIAKHNWWGTPTGLDEINRVFIDLPGSGSIDASDPLSEDPI